MEYYSFIKRNGGIEQMVQKGTLAYMIKLFSTKGAKNIHWGKDSLFNKWYWQNRISTCKSVKYLPLHPIQKLTQNGSKT